MAREDAVSVRMAATEGDFEAARDLCRAWLDWQLRTFPDLRATILTTFEPVAYARTLAALPAIHARPKGAILLADFGARTVGCVMYQEMEPGVVEVKRLFVREEGRGHGVGEALLTGMLASMRADGYGTCRFSSARFLTAARRLYERMGFAEIPSPPGTPAHVYFMERPI
ncbi:GNAT family N-acetyltransferase [Acuticoccus kandeliae]|uniref:GNAT family N-acetyltransferase n=1 Tax=Acuticoccus kandeliae TaxID=2073160 RepID=UPI001300BB48|nr:GNAT family N-acetyltransferase [Acuticoccus kandeliae]